MARPPRQPPFGRRLLGWSLAGLGLAGLGVLWGGATRADPDGWTLNGSSSVTLGLDINAADSGGGGGGGGDSLRPRLSPRLALVAVRESRGGSLTLNGAVSPVIADDAPSNPLGFMAPSGGARLAIAGKRVNFTTGVTAAVRSTNFSRSLLAEEPEDPEIPFDPDRLVRVRGDALQYTVGGTAGVGWSLSDRDTLSLNGTLRRRDYFEGATSLVPNTSAALSLGWSRALTNRVDASLGTSVTWFNATPEAGSGAAGSESVTFGINTGASYAATRRLGLSAGIGVSFVDTLSRTGGTGGTGSRDTGLDISLNGNLGFTYTGAETTLGGTFAQSVEPSSSGELQNTTSANLSVAQALTADTTFAFQTRFLMQTPLGSGEGDSTDRRILRFTPSLSTALAETTSLRLGYALDLTDEEGEEPVSHSVFLTLSRGFSLLK